MKIGLIINPVAGLGGPAGLKGSDGKAIQTLALEKGSRFLSNARVEIALSQLFDVQGALHFYTGSGLMGEALLQKMGFACEVVHVCSNETEPQDTMQLAQAIFSQNVDLLVFAGGDGTARDVYTALNDSFLPCVGIPAGVKIHSAVYANTPKDAGMLILQWVKNQQNLPCVEREVMDINEEKFRAGIVDAKLYGYLTVPIAHNLMQSSKASFKVSAHDVSGITDEVRDRMKTKPPDTCYIFGTGGTTFHILKTMGYEGSLLGVDVLYRQQIALKDASETELFDFIKDKECVLVITVIGRQGHILGRGNQQLSSRILTLFKKENIWITSTGDKIYALPHNTLYADTSDPELDEAFSGYWKVIIGWQMQIVCGVNLPKII